MGNSITTISEFVYRFVALNVLWCFFFLLGLGVLGFMPATVALFSVVREWLKGEKHISLFSSYFKFYKAEFVRSNMNGAIFMIVFYIIYINFQFVPFFYDESIHFFLYVTIAGVAAIAIMTFLNLFSVMAHFEFKQFQYIKAAVGLVFAHPMKSVMQLVWVIAYLLLAIYYPKAFIIIGVSVFAYVVMSINYSTFNKYNTV